MIEQDTLPPAAEGQTSLEALIEKVAQRRTFAIISHPDAGKTTLTEKLLLFGGAIQMAGTVKGRKSGRHATSDWMEVEKQRGISVTSSVMQFEHGGCVFNLLDTPGHQDFSEDTYRVLTAVDAAVMVIDAAKGVEEQTIKLLEVCRLRNTPIITFINKMDREVREPAGTAGRDRVRAEDPLRAGDLADRHGQALPGRVPPAERRNPALHARRGKRRPGSGNPEGPGQSAPGPGTSRWKRKPCGAKSNWCAARAPPSTWTPSSPARRSPVFFGSASTTSACAKCCARWPTGHRRRCRARPASGRCSRPKPSSPASCSRSRPTWIRSTATASPSCASAPAATSRG